MTVRILHWLNALAVLVMIASGWRIYNNDPIFTWLNFPIGATLGGDPEITYRHNGDVGFGNALLWHYAFMWLLVINGLIYLAYGLITGRFRRKLLPLPASEFGRNIVDALRFRSPSRLCCARVVRVHIVIPGSVSQPLGITYTRPLNPSRTGS